MTNGKKQLIEDLEYATLYSFGYCFMFSLFFGRFFSSVLFLASYPIILVLFFRGYFLDKRDEKLKIMREFRSHPDREEARRMAQKAAQGARFWKFCHIWRMWKEIWENSCYRVYR